MKFLEPSILRAGALKLAAVLIGVLVAYGVAVTALVVVHLTGEGGYCS